MLNDISHHQHLFEECEKTKFAPNECCFHSFSLQQFHVILLIFSSWRVCYRANLFAKFFPSVGNMFSPAALSNSFSRAFLKVKLCIVRNFTQQKTRLKWTELDGDRTNRRPWLPVPAAFLIIFFSIDAYATSLLLTHVDSFGSLILYGFPIVNLSICVRFWILNKMGFLISCRASWSDLSTISPTCRQLEKCCRETTASNGKFLPLCW